MKPLKEPAVKAIIFDLGNVLIHYDLRQAARRFSKICGVPLMRLWLHLLTSPLEEDYSCGRVASREFYRRLKRALRLSVSYPVFRSAWNEIFWENRGMEGLLIALKKKYPLYMLTNTNALHFGYLKKKYGRLFRHFRKVFASHRIKCRKPDAPAYRKVLAGTGLKASEAIFIDDQPRFVRGARRAGIRAVRFRGRQGLVRDLRRMGVRV